MVTECNYANDWDSITDRIIRDVLIIGCNLSRAKDKIIRKGHEIALKDVINILQLEEPTSTTLTTIGADQKSMHYTRYDSKMKALKVEKQRLHKLLLRRIPKQNLQKEHYAIAAENLIQKDTMKSAKPNTQNGNHANRLDTTQIVV